MDGALGGARPEPIGARDPDPRKKFTYLERSTAAQGFTWSIQLIARYHDCNSLRTKSPNMGFFWVMALISRYVTKIMRVLRYLFAAC